MPSGMGNCFNLWLYANSQIHISHSSAASKRSAVDRDCVYVLLAQIYTMSTRFLLGPTLGRKSSVMAKERKKRMVTEKELQAHTRELFWTMIETLERLGMNR